MINTPWMEEIQMVMLVRHEYFGQTWLYLKWTLPSRNLGLSIMDCHCVLFAEAFGFIISSSLQRLYERVP